MYNGDIIYHIIKLLKSNELLLDTQYDLRK